MDNIRKLLYKYLMIYAGLLIIIIIGNIWIVRVAKQLSWEDRISEEEVNLEKRVLGFEKEVDAMQSFSNHIATLDSMEVLKRAKGELKVSKYVEMNDAREQLKTYCIIGNLPYTFVLFRDNPIFLSEFQVSKDYEAYYKSFMQSDSLTASEFKELIFELPNSVNYFSLETLQYYDERTVTLENPLLVVIKPTLPSGRIEKDFCCVFVLSKEEVLGYMLENDLDNTIAYVSDNTGKIMIQYGISLTTEADFMDAEYKNQQDTYRLLRAKTENGTLTICYGVAYSTVNGQVIRRFHGVYGLLIALVVYTIFAVFFLVWRRYKPAKRMIEYLSEATDRKIVASDEYEYVEKTTNTLIQIRTDLKKQLSELKRDMNNSILTNVLKGGIINEKDKERLKNIVPNNLEYYYVIVFHSEDITPENLYEVSQCLMNCFCQVCGDFLYVIHCDFLETVFLMQQKEKDVIDLSKMERRLKSIANQVTKQMDVVFSIGVSGIGSEISGMNKAYEQAKQAYVYTMREHENTLGCYSIIKEEIGNESFEVTGLFRVYDYIIACNKDAIERTLNRMVKLCERSGNSRQNKEIFYSISYIVSSAYEKLGFPGEMEQRHYWDPNSTLCSQIEVLKEQIYLLIDKYNKNKKSHNIELKNNILQYIEENYMNVNLNALEVCEVMHISEKYLMQFLKEQTLKSFSKCLEDIRINKAKEYLLHTEYSNSAIAEAVGFGSKNTFYRVFNKLEETTPSNWKKENRR